MEITLTDLIFFGAVWIIAAAAGASRVTFNGDFKSWTFCIGTTVFSGFVGYMVVSIFYSICHKYEIELIPHMYLGLAAGVGCMGREQVTLIRTLTKAISTVLGGFLKRIGIQGDEQ